MTKEQEIIERSISRIVRMEHDLDAVLEALSFQGKDSDPEIGERMMRLSAYLDSGQWLEDYRLDEEGKLPADLKRGVLSEDTLYNLLTDYDAVKFE